MSTVQKTASDNIIPVTIKLQQQSTPYFKRSGELYHKGNIYFPSQCPMESGKQIFIFMGKMKFGRAELRCAPTLEEFQDIEQKSPPNC